MSESDKLARAGGRGITSDRNMRTFDIWKGSIPGLMPTNHSLLRAPSGSWQNYFLRADGGGCPFFGPMVGQFSSGGGIFKGRRGTFGGFEGALWHEEAARRRYRFCNNEVGRDGGWFRLQLVVEDHLVWRRADDQPFQFPFYYSSLFYSIVIIRYPVN